MTTILDIRPGLSGMLARAREALPAEALRTLDEHVTQAERLVSDVFGDVQVWRLAGSDSLWVTLPDLASVMEVDPSAVRHQLLGGEIGDEDVRRSVRDEDLAVSNPHGCRLTTSPTGVTLLTLRAARLLVMSCRGERGVRFRAGLDRLLDTASATERLLAALLLDRASPGDPRLQLRIATGLRLAGDRQGAALLLRRLAGLPEMAPPPVAVAAPEAPTDPLVAWLEDRTETSAGEVAEAFGWSRVRAGLALTRLGWVRVRRPGGRGPRAWLYRAPRQLRLVE